MHLVSKLSLGILLSFAGYGCFKQAVTPRIAPKAAGAVATDGVVDTTTTPNALVEEHLRTCSERQRPEVLPRTSLLNSEYVVPQGVQTTGETITGYIIARDANGTATCEPHDFFEITAWSERNRVFVTTASLGYGVYSFTFKARMPGVFNVSIHLMYESATQVGRSWPTSDELYTDFQNATFWRKMSQKFDALKKQNTTEWCPSPRAEFVNHRIHITVAGNEILPAAPCGQTWHKSNGLAGSWVKAEKEACYPGLCEGDLAFMASDGWVWVPDTCYLRLYNKESAWDCLNGKRLVWFGDSTLKQPATNLVENLLGVPILRRSFNYVKQFCPKGPKIHKRNYINKRKKHTARGCTGPFDHRQWKINRTNPHNSDQLVHLQYVWGGSVSVMDPPMRKPTGYGLLLQETPTRNIFRAALATKPDYLFLHHYVWDDMAQMDHPRFANEIGKFVESLLNSTTADIHWDTPHPQCMSNLLDNDVAMCVSAVENKLNSAGAFQSSLSMMRHLDERIGNNPRLTVTERYQMAQPHVMELKYCYFGIHFGSQEAFCHVTAPEGPEACIRSSNWLVDKFESQTWMNKMCSNPPKATSADPTITLDVWPLFPLLGVVLSISFFISAPR